MSGAARVAGSASPRLGASGGETPAAAFERACFGRDDARILAVAAAIAFALELALLTAIAWREHWLAHPQASTGLDASRFIEAQVITLPEEQPMLHSEKPAPRVHEAALSKEPGKGRPARDAGAEKPSESNVTESGPPALGPTHGPVAVFAPPPVIPTYLRSERLKASVIIEFFVTRQASVTPRLLASSGNEELDQVALRAVASWKFRPAEQGHKPIDSKVRLRINFQVE